jgi:hypothetical protein
MGKVSSLSYEEKENISKHSIPRNDNVLSSANKGRGSQLVSLGLKKYDQEIIAMNEYDTKERKRQKAAEHLSVDSDDDFIDSRSTSAVKKMNPRDSAVEDRFVGVEDDFADASILSVRGKTDWTYPHAAKNSIPFLAPVKIPEKTFEHFE